MPALQCKPDHVRTAEEALAAARTAAARRETLMGPRPAPVILKLPEPKYPIVLKKYRWRKILSIDGAWEPYQRFHADWAGEVAYDDRLTTKQIFREVGRLFGFSILELVGEQRYQRIIYARHVAMWLCRKHLKLSYPHIGMRMGGRDHTTVIHACRKIEGRLQTDFALRASISSLEMKLGVDLTFPLKAEVTV